MKPTGQLTLFAEVSLNFANHFPLLGSEEARRMTVTSGRKCLELSRNSAPLGCLEKMLLTSSAWDSTMRYLTWKTRDTKQGRLLFRLLPSTPRIDGTGFGLWHTPSASDGEGGIMKMYPDKAGRYKLRDHVQEINKEFWPTPRAGSGMTSPLRNPENIKENGNGRLEDVIALQEEAATRRYLNPAWVGWLMGFPLGWLDIGTENQPSPEQ